VDPRALSAVSRLKGSDFVVAPQRQCDFVDTFEQPGAAARVDLETMLLTRRQSDLLLPEIDTDPPGALRGLDLSREAVDNRFVDDDRQDSVLKAVGEENVAEARPDESANTQFLQ
jgi:hypothetical protein